MTPVKDFWERFDAVDQELLLRDLEAPFVSADEIHLAEYPYFRPDPGELRRLALETNLELRKLFPLATTVWLRECEPLLEIKPMREVFRVRLANGRTFLVENPYLSYCVVDYDDPRVPLHRLGGPADSVGVVIPDALAMIMRNPIRVKDSVSAVIHEVCHFALLPFLMGRLTDMAFERFNEPFTRALTAILGKEHPGFSSATSTYLRTDLGRELYKASGRNPQRLLEIVLQ